MEIDQVRDPETIYRAKTKVPKTYFNKSRKFLSVKKNTLLVRLSEAWKDFVLDKPFVEDWNGMNAMAVNDDLFNHTRAQVDNFAKHLAFKRSDVSIEIDALSDGSIDVYWERSTSKLLMNFKKTEAGFSSTFYGETVNKQSSLKLESQNGIIPTQVILWMNEH